MKMLVSALALGLCLATSVQAQAPVQAGRDPAAEARIHADVAFLADDAVEGRGTGHRGYDIAAQYVQSRMQAMGLMPGANGSWRQPVTVARMGVQEATLTWTPARGAPVVWTSGADALFGIPREARIAITMPTSCSWATAWSRTMRD